MFDDRPFNMKLGFVTNLIKRHKNIICPLENACSAVYYTRYRNNAILYPYRSLALFVVPSTNKYGIWSLWSMYYTPQLLSARTDVCHDGNWYNGKAMYGLCIRMKTILSRGFRWAQTWPTSPVILKLMAVKDLRLRTGSTTWKRTQKCPWDDWTSYSEVYPLLSKVSNLLLPTVLTHLAHPLTPSLMPRNLLATIPDPPDPGWLQYHASSSVQYWSLWFWIRFRLSCHVSASNGLIEPNIRSANRGWSRTASLSCTRGRSVCWYQYWS